MRIDHRTTLATAPIGFRARLATPLFLFLLLLAAPSAHADAPAGEPDAPTDRELWYVLTIGDERVGNMVSRTSVLDDGDLLTESNLEMRINRLGAEVAFDVRTGFRETPDGEPVEMRVSQNFGGVALRQRFMFESRTRVRVLTRQFGSVNTEIRTIAGDWLTPAAAARFVSDRLQAGADEFSYSSIDPTAGAEPITITTRVEDRDTAVEVFGRSVPAVRTRSSISLLDGVESVEHLSPAGEMLRTEIDMGGLTVAVLAADKALATSEFDAPELMARSFVAPVGEMPRPRETARVVYTLRSTTGDLREPPSAGRQRTDLIGPAAARVTVRTDAEPLPDPAAADDPAYTNPSPIIDADDPAVALLAEDVRAAHPDAAPAELARAAERRVATHLRSKNLSVGFATASEAVRTREGDCTEHAVLLAALLRAVDIPARTVSGLVFVDQWRGAEDVFSYHMWTQALIPTDAGPAWIDLDAAVLSDDASRIALSASAFEHDDTFNALLPMIETMNALEITIESVEHR